jgi:hypothetical protein
LHAKVPVGALCIALFVLNIIVLVFLIFSTTLLLHFRALVFAAKSRKLKALDADDD